MIDSHSQDFLYSQALGSLWGLAIGDALGMPTQDLPPDVINADYGYIRDLLPAGPHQKIAAGMQAGSITDDTEQAIIVAKLYAQSGRIDPKDFCEEMLAWENSMKKRGSLDLLGPSTKKALLALHNGVPLEKIGHTGTTNGAAMRIAPIGIAVASEPDSELVNAVVQASRITHNTSVALAGAAAIAGVISAALDGQNKSQAIEYALTISTSAGACGQSVIAPDIAQRARWAIPFLAHEPQKTDALYHIIGTSMQSHESVVAALAITALDISDWDAVCLAASAGADTDTIAAMVGAMRGALSGVSTWPRNAIEKISKRNHLNFHELATTLLRHRKA